MNEKKYDNLLGDICEGPFSPSFLELDRQNVYPQWFNKAKFGIWAHWGPQAVGEDGDWYARYMYDPNCTHFSWNQNQSHVSKFGHPSEFGYKDILPLWTADKWNPEKLMELYKKAGAKYFMAMAVHHDNFDCYNSKYQQWNSVNIGPKKDIVGIWRELAQKNDMHFGASVHSDYSWWWWQSAFCCDLEGEYKGIPYDGAKNLTGDGKFFSGLDLKDLYGIDMKSDITFTDEFTDLRRDFFNGIPERLKDPKNIEFLIYFMKKWFDRVCDLIDNYDLDLLYFDGASGDFYPFSGTGTGRGIKSNATEKIAAHLYNTSYKKHGSNESLLAIKTRKGNATLLDCESYFDNEIKPYPWQQDVTIGEWFYRHNFKYNTAAVIFQLLEVVSRNGNLLLNVPLNHRGELDEQGEQLLISLGQWMDICGEGIYETVPFIKCSEGENRMPNGNLCDPSIIQFNKTDFRFTRKDNAVYAFCLTEPNGEVIIKSFKDFTNDTDWGKEVKKVELLGHGLLDFVQDKDGLHINMPNNLPTRYAVCFKVTFVM